MEKVLNKKHKNEDNSFVEDVVNGLGKYPKKLSSKYLYNAEGDRLFQQIMHLPEYYVTRCEHEILETQKQTILSLCAEPFQLIDLGAGDGLKTMALLDYFIKKKAAFQYLPIDISASAVNQLSDKVKNRFPKLSVEGITAEYFEALRRLKLDQNLSKVILLFGSNIGNFSHPEAVDFLSEMKSSLNKGDLLVIGFDLKKDPEIILKAYNDSQGVTAQFNYNLLNRINHELGGDFKTENFKFCPTYNPETGEVKSYLISKTKQVVTLKKVNACFDFDAWESIHTECSNKYDLYDITSFAEAAGFEIVTNLYDSKKYFTDSVWRVI